MEAAIRLRGWPAFTGWLRRIKDVLRMASCSRCGGSGNCSHCGGSGYVHDTFSNVVCGTCGGKGKCTACGGKG